MCYARFFLKYQPAIPVPVRLCHCWLLVWYLVWTETKTTSMTDLQNAASNACRQFLMKIGDIFHQKNASSYRRVKHRSFQIGWWSKMQKKYLPHLRCVIIYSTYIHFLNSYCFFSTLVLFITHFCGHFGIFKYALADNL